MIYKSEKAENKRTICTVILIIAESTKHYISVADDAETETIIVY